VAARKVQADKAFAEKIQKRLTSLSYLRDIRIAEAVNYPVLEIDIDRDLAGQFGLTIEEVKNSLVAATSSTRFINRNLWIDPNSGLPFQVQVALPDGDINSEKQLRALPIKAGSVRPILEDVAVIRHTTAPAQVNRKGPNRYVKIGRASCREEWR